MLEIEPTKVVPVHGEFISNLVPTAAPTITPRPMDIPDLTPLQWAFAVVLLLLAMAGIYYLYTLCCGYRCLPLETAACEGGEPHFLVYVTGPEKAALAKIAKHKGPPPLCHGIDSYPTNHNTPPSSPSAKRQKRSDQDPQQAPDQWAEGEETLEDRRVDSAETAYRHATYFPQRMQPLKRALVDLQPEPTDTTTEIGF